MISNRGGGGECDKRGRMMSSAEICVFCGRGGMTAMLTCSPELFIDTSLML